MHIDAGAFDVFNPDRVEHDLDVRPRLLLSTRDFGSRVAAGDTISLRVNPERLYIFDAETGSAIA